VTSCLQLTLKHFVRLSFWTSSMRVTCPAYSIVLYVFSPIISVAYLFNAKTLLQTNLIQMTNKMQLCRIIYCSIFPWLFNMFRAILSLIIRSILTVIAASGFIHMCCCRLLSWLNSNIIAHHQEHLNCNCSFWFHSHVLLPVVVLAE